MRTIYELDPNRVWTGASRQVTDKEGRPTNWVATEITPPTGGFARWTGVAWEQLNEYPTPTPEPEPVPTDVSAAAAREALIDAGLLDAVPAAIDAIPDATIRAKARVWWEYATRIRRDSPWVDMLAPEIGLDDNARDNLFRAAAVIERAAAIEQAA